ncbi:TetR family transcriptional regulator [Kocuria coralli]|uniref:TetR family transcriptional regulator n=1 Tax=Kocuria coralli TaxID=1461025 RepID=A0A5J5KX67_9MICC|nr:TetR family transcriptional regulator [Kocuria coralli]KAA9394269.1 TetR family transcriptional regulator [Kocuria coralli]
MQEKSLRERKKAETWEAIHREAAEAVLERGLDSVTVDEIAQAVGISSRTFFNYFPTKDHAVLGLRDPVVPEDTLADLTPGSGLLRQVVTLLDQVVVSARPATTPSLRHRLLNQHPELMGLHKQTLHRTEDLVRAALLQRLAEQPPSDLTEDDAVSMTERVRMLVLVAGSILRFAWTGSGHVPGQDPTPQDYDHAVAVYHFLNRTDLS